jgi:protocatechuate 3,4-dioxygenase beta subunit
VAAEVNPNQDAITSTVMIAPEEPGERLILRGTVFAADGTTPLPDAAVYIYHTDAAGVYSEDDAGMNERRPRLHCRLTTDAHGRYAVRTILPGPYPGGKTPRHIHIILTSPDGAEHNATFSFAGDPNLTRDDYARHGRDGAFSSIRPAERTADGSLECVRDIRMRPPR